MEAENAHLTAANGDAWTEMTDRVGFSGASALQALPNNGTLINTGYAVSSPEMKFDVQLSQGGRYWVWVRMWAANDLDNSVHAGYNGAETGSAGAIEQTGYNNWQWTRNRKYSTDDAYIDAVSGLHTVSVWMREDGVYIDKVVLTTDESYVPTGVGPAESPRDGGTGGNQSPIASFTTNIDGLTVDFTSTSTDPDGDIDSWVWDFGDGGSALTGTVTHTYVAAGSYTVTLTVQDMEGASASTQQTVTVTDGTNLPPVISVAIDPGKTVGHGAVVTFDASATTDPDGDLMTFQWFDAGNQLLGSGELYVHTTATSGTSEVIRLEVSDSQLTSEETITLTLTEESKRFYYVKDHLGSIRAVVNETGDVVSYADYYPFGLLLRSQQSDLTKENYTGHELDTETGLLYAGARYYLPEIGRWGSVDPLAEKFTGWSSYNYVFNNPTALTDPLGLMPCCNTGLNSLSSLILYLRALSGDELAQRGVKLHLGLVAGVSSLAVGGGLVASRILSNVLARPATSILFAKEGVDFAVGALYDIPDPEGVGGGNLGQLLNGSGLIGSIFKKHHDDVINIIHHADRLGARNVVEGGLAGAIIHTKLTGELIGGSDHIIKGKNTIRALKKRLKRVSNAIDLSDEQRAYLTDLIRTKINEIQEALDFSPE